MHKDTKGKTKLNLIPLKALRKVANVREFGNNKYPSPDGKSYLKFVKENDLVEAAWRHILEHLEGRLDDGESGELHLAHAATSLLMAIEIIETNKEKENGSRKSDNFDYDCRRPRKRQSAK